MRKRFYKLLALAVGALIPWSVVHATDYYDASGVPAARSLLNSADMRAEFLAIQTGISEKLPALTGNGDKVVVVNSGGTALTVNTSGIAVAGGGTGATTAAGARTNLGLVIGTDVQAWDDDLDDLAALTPTDSNFIVGNGTDWVAETGATARTSLGLGSIATQASSSVSITGGSITGITDLAVADGGTGAGTAAAARTNLGLVIGTDVQAYDAGLADVAGLAVTDGNFIVGDGANWVAESSNIARTSLGVGTGQAPQFSAVNIGNASDTTLARSGAGEITIEGDAIWNAGNDGTGSGLDADTLDGEEADDLATKEIDQNAQNGDYTLVLADSGKHIYKSSGAGNTITVPANASVAYPIGTVITIINDSGGNSVSIAITTDTMIEAGTGNTGTRTLADHGMATIIKVGTTTWFISGVGIT